MYNGSSSSKIADGFSKHNSSQLLYCNSSIIQELFNQPSYWPQMTCCYFYSLEGTYLQGLQDSGNIAGTHISTASIDISSNFRRWSQVWFRVYGKSSPHSIYQECHYIKTATSLWGPNSLYSESKVASFWLSTYYCSPCLWLCQENCLPHDWNINKKYG